MNPLVTEMPADPVIPVFQGETDCRRAAERWQLEVAREMLSTMDSLTFGGQRYVMEKLVALIGRLLADSHLGHGRRNRAALREQLEQLTHLSTRDCPDARTFVRRAEGLLDLLVTPL